MGDPRKQKKKYSKPGKIWDSERIERDKELMKEYGLRRKKEIWKAESFLRDLRRQAKNLIARRGEEQAKKEADQLILRLVKLNLIKGGAILEDVLGLDLKSILERRLQSIVYRGKLAKSMKQARQFVVHGHISIVDNKINVPSYLVKADEEKKIKFSISSNLSRDDHPERAKEVRRTKEQKKKEGVEDKDAVEIFERAVEKNIESTDIREE